MAHGGIETDPALSAAPERRAGEEAAQHRRLRPGECLGRFEIVRELARRGAATVYEARDKTLCRSVALKLVDSSRRRDAVGEAEALAALRHPAIVTFHELGFSAAGDYLVLELAEGELLSQRLDRGPLPLRQALDVALDVARALDHAHAQGVVLRSLHPGAVRLRSDGAKLVDAGMAVVGGAPAARAETGAFSAPEQRAGMDGDARSDVYAAAALLLASLGCPPGNGKAATAALEDLPRPLRRLLRDALSVEPAARPVSGRAWLARLEAADRQLRAWRRWARAAGAVGALGALAVALSIAAVARHARGDQDIRALVSRAKAACEGGERDLCLELLRRAAGEHGAAAVASGTKPVPAPHPSHRAPPGN